MLSVTCVIQVLPLSGPTKPSDKVVQNCSETFYSKKHLPNFSWRNGRNPSMAQSLEVRRCIFHMVVHAMKMKNKEELLETEKPNHLQCQHEEADTLLAFHTNSISSGTILVRSTDTDVLIILLGLAGRSGTYQSLTTEEVDILGVTSFVCLLYGLKNIQHY